MYNIVEKLCSFASKYQRQARSKQEQGNGPINRFEGKEKMTREDIQNAKII